MGLAVTMKARDMGLSHSLNLCNNTMNFAETNKIF
jgi:hypothetical protein